MDILMDLWTELDLSSHSPYTIPLFSVSTMSPLSALGSPAHLSLQHLQDSVNLSCSSCGWFPQPRLLWNSPNEKGDALSNTQSPVYRQQENGLFCAYGWVILSSSFSKSISCSVSLSEDEKRDMSFDLDARPSGLL